MVQSFKSLYLTDDKMDSSEKSITLAFGKKDTDLYSMIKDLSSVEIRDLLGSRDYTTLGAEAKSQGYSFNSYCLKILRDAAKSSQHLNSYELIDPIHTTFRGGLGDPLHNWYPYLEGYSPDFVSAIIARYMPYAKTIYDPFGGSGTTPITAAKMDLQGFYSEVNPVMQVVTEAKISARKLSLKQRSEVILNLQQITEDLETLLGNLFPDEQLESAYKACFGDSRFFDPKTYTKVLRMRTLIDTLSNTAPDTSKFLLVAVLRALVPSSLLQRAGDLRYKTPKELDAKLKPFVNEVKLNLERICDDLGKVDTITKAPLFLTENAKNISKLTPQSFDGVITSPPYLNGTNYFRNTKIELWFIRGITTAKDLTAFRAKAVTAGINDVTTRKNAEPLSQRLHDLVAALSSKAYDQRIPRMVHYYFIDMLKIFRGLEVHLHKGSKVAIDIGDSIYGGIHVPTDDILKELLTNEGYQLCDEVLLRKRTSRSGQTLKQTLLIFTYTGKMEQKDNLRSKLETWETFKSQQPHHIYPYSKRNWGHPLHSLCSYQGKMKPALAHYLIKSFTKPGDTILDPFVGVGTIPFEGALNGVKTFGFDISPAAVVISKAKLGTLNAEKCNIILNELEKYLLTQHFTDEEFAAARNFGYNRKLAEYYNEDTLKEILSARRFFKDIPHLDDNESLVMACLLHILHGNRPYALSRRSHGITPFAPTGDYEYRPLIPRLRSKVEKSLLALPNDQYVPGKIFFQDITASWPSEVDELDSIITSPPFFDSTRFYSANWLRLWFAGWNDNEFKIKPKIFIDEKQRRNFDVYENIFRQSRERLKKGGFLVLHLGKSRKADMAYELAKKAEPWFSVVDIFTENVEHTESHGIRDKGSVFEHQYLILN